MSNDESDEMARDRDEILLGLQLLCAVFSVTQNQIQHQYLTLGQFKCMVQHRFQK